MRAFVLVTVIAVVTLGCGDSPSAPTVVAPPPPSYPSMVGGWSGSHTYSGVIAGSAGSGSCAQTWVITSQNGGNFLGTFQTSGGTPVPCAQSGTVEGVVTPTGGITDIVLGANINPLTGCTRTSRTAFAGVLSGSTLTAQTTETLNCTGVGTVNRSFTLTLTRR